MTTKLIYILAAATLTFASAGAGGRQSAGSARERITMVYQPQENGDYRLYLFGSGRALVCEEQDLRVIEQGDAVSPVVIECKHDEAGPTALTQGKAARR